MASQNNIYPLFFILERVRNGYILTAKEETGGLKDSIQDSGDGNGNGFTFQNYNSGDMVYAVQRALTGYENKEGWSILVERALKSDNSWGRSANEYIRLYKQLLK